MDLEVERLKLLLAEKAHVEQRFTSNLDLQQKAMVFGFTAMVTALGWVATTRLGANQTATILLAIVSINAIAMLMAVAYGGFALAALNVKASLGKIFQEILLLRKEENFLDTVEVTRPLAATGVVRCATKLFSFSQVCVTLAAYGGALWMAEWRPDGVLEKRLVTGAILAGVLLFGAVLSLVKFFRALR